MEFEEPRMIQGRRWKVDSDNLTRRTTAMPRSHEPELGHTDFIAAFTDGNLFAIDGKPIQVNRQRIGSLVVPTGRIIGCDPCYLSPRDDIAPYSRRVPPGRYRVEMAAAKFGKWIYPACLLLRLKSTVPVHWENALSPRSRKVKVPKGSHVGYGVDSGLGSFCDHGAVRQWFRKPTGEWNDMLKPHWTSLTARHPWCEVVLSAETGANLIACKAGYGDGCYATYWGFDRAGDAAWLVTDFGVLVEPTSISVMVDDPASRLGKSIDDPVLKAAGFDLCFARDKKSGGVRLESREHSIDAELIAHTGDKIHGRLSTRRSAKGRTVTLTFRCDPAKAAKLKITFPGETRPLTPIRPPQ
jgi:hypothetical protein